VISTANASLYLIDMPVRSAYTSFMKPMFYQSNCLLSPLQKSRKQGKGGDGAVKTSWGRKGCAFSDEATRSGYLAADGRQPYDRLPALVCRK
jgi:hypothetical protein